MYNAILIHRSLSLYYHESSFGSSESEQEVQYLETKNLFRYCPTFIFEREMLIWFYYLLHESALSCCMTLGPNLRENSRSGK